MANKFENAASESPNLHVLTTSYKHLTEPTQVGRTETEHDIQEMMTRLFKNEAENDKSKKSVDEMHAENLFKSNLKFENGRYWVQPLFKKNYIPMLNNYNIALKRYKSLRRSLARKP